MGKMKQLQQKNEEENDRKFFATNNPFQVLALEIAHNQKSLGWLAKEGESKWYIIFDQNEVVNRHLAQWEEVQSDDLSGVEILSSYLCNLLEGNSLRNFSRVFQRLEDEYGHK